MATPVTFNGAAYSIPAVGERQWGQNVSNFLIAVAGNALSKAGGSFVLTTADVNFGTTYGLVTAYIKGAIGNISSSGVIRLANLDAISWRNAANIADLALRVDSNNRLQFNAVNIPTISSTDILSGKSMDGATNTFTNLPVGVTGIAAIANGGTAVSSLPTVQQTSAFAAWDANQNLSANNIVNDYATTATAGGTTTLTVSSKRVQFFTGTLTQTVTLPVASTLTLGHNYYIRNLSTGVVTIQSSGANTVIAMQPQDGIIVTCILASGTSAASWSVFSELANNSATGALALPSGTAAQRPTAVAGQVRLNTDSNSFEGFANGIWSSIGGGLNELPQKNYLKTWSESAVSPGTLSQLGSTTANLASLTAFYTDSGSSTSALATSTDSTLRGTVNYLSNVSGSNNNGSRFFQFPAQQLEGSDLGKPVSISFDVSGVATDGNWDAVIVRYNSSGVYQNTLTIAGNVSGATAFPSAKLPTGTTTFNGFFVPDSTTASDIYALRLRSLANAVNIRVDTLFIGPQPIRVGAAITDWQSYTPTFTNLTLGNGAVSGFWRRNGDSVEIAVDVNFGTTSSVAGSLYFNLPTGLNIDTSKIYTADYGYLGTAMAQVAGSEYTGSVTYRDATTCQILNGSTTGGSYWNATNPATWGTNATNVLSAKLSAPITGWSSNVTMADRAVESYLWNSSATTSTDTTSFGYGPSGFAFQAFAPAGTASVNKRVRSLTPLQPTSKIVVEINDNTSGSSAWVEAASAYYGGPFTLNDAGTTAYGIIIDQVSGSSTDIDVKFFSRPTPAATWRTSSSWRVRVTDAGAQVGFPISSANIVGRVDGNAPATGMVGEVITSSAMTATAPTTSYVNVTNASVALTAGTWEVYYSISLQAITNTSIGNETIISVQLYNNTDATIVSASQRSVAAYTPVASNSKALGAVAFSTVVNIGSSKTYTIQTKRTDVSGIGTSNLLNSSEYTSTFYAIRRA